MIDCLIIGFNDYSFSDYVEMVRAMGTGSGAYRDLNLAFVEYDNGPKRSMDMLNHFYFADKIGVQKYFHNADFLWPVVLYLGTYLHRKGFSFDYVNLFHLEKDKLKEKLLYNDILTVAITTTLYVIPHPILDIISFIRQYNEKVKIIVGGPYISNQVKMFESKETKQLFKNIGADIYVISQEGELTLTHIISALKQNQTLENIHNIAYKEGNNYIVTQPAVEYNPLEENQVDYTLFPKQDFGEFVTLRTAKSCPFSCAFCGFPQRAGKYTYLGVDLVELELNKIRDLETITTLTFIDDTFNVPKKRFKDLLKMMIRNNYGFKWNCFYRSDHGDRETIELMKEAGCEGVFLGVESGSDKMLVRMNKTARQKDYRTAIPLFREAGISTYASIIIGFPGETGETVRETIDFLEEMKPDFYRTQLWYCDPITPIWQKRLEYDIQGSSFNWSHRTMDSKAACNWIDRTFLTVENSIWLPQHSFEQWSTFYLQRKGMSMEQIKVFLKCFNALIRDKLIYPAKKEISDDLLTALKNSCCFDQPQKEVNIASVDRFSVSSYAADEKFWLNEFSSRRITSNIGMVRDTDSIEDQEQAYKRIVVKKTLLSQIAAICQVHIAYTSLAVFSILLARLNGQAETVIITATYEKGQYNVVPLYLRPDLQLGFKDFARSVEQKHLECMKHKLYSFPVLMNSLQIKSEDSAVPGFDVGYLYCEDTSAQGKINLEQALQYYSQINQGIGLAVEMFNDGDVVNLQFSYKKNWFHTKVIDALETYMSLLLEQAGKDVDIQLGQLLMTYNIDEHRATSTDEQANFKF